MYTHVRRRMIRSRVRAGSRLRGTGSRSEMASKEAVASLTAEEKDHDQSGPIVPWQKAWLAKHRDKLIRRVPTVDIVDQLIPRRAMDIEMDVYQRIRACNEELRNDRARLLLDYVASHTMKIFWDFQEALTLVGCGDLAIRREDVQEVAESFSASELSAAAAPCRPKKPRAASVEYVIEELKSRYRQRKVPSLDGQVPRKAVSLDEIRVNICLLSAEKLNALCGCGSQRQPFEMSSLEGVEDSLVELEDLFNQNENGEVPRMQVASGIAGSGKTMAFTLKASYEWAKKDRRRPFWENITMYFEGSLTDPDWWNAETIAEVFGLPHHDLTMQEEKEVVRYICSHASEILLVADSMDEADVKVNSFLWRVLTGNCKAVEGLKVIICSRPCEKTSWLARTYLFDRHLEVVGFTEEKIGQFVETYFGTDSTEARSLQEQLASRPNVRSLMHTPLLATMICRRFDSSTTDAALPSNQTDVYEEAVIAMVCQSVQDSGKVPNSILAELCPRHLHVAVVNLSQLAYSALTKKHVVFPRSELEEASCLGHAVQLGFLSLSPGANISGRGQDVYSFPHHTMKEFFAAVHAVRQLIGTGEKTIDDLVDELGVDGDLSRFWLFVSGLLGSEQCETLLGALSRQIYKGTTSYPELSRRQMLVIECFAECESKLKEHRSAAIALLIKSKGLAFSFFRPSVNQVHAVSRVILRYRDELRSVVFSAASMNTASMALILAGLQECSNLRALYLPESAFALETVDRVITVIERNAKSLERLRMPLSDDRFPVSPAIVNCLRLRELTIGSQALTNAGSQLVVDVLKCQRLAKFLLIGRLNDDGFAPIASSLRSSSMAEKLTELHLRELDLSHAMISSTVSSLTNLSTFGLYAVPIGDAGLRQIAQHLVELRQVNLHNIDLTPLCIPVLDMLVCQMPVNGVCEVAVERSVFKPIDQVIADIVETTSLQLVVKKSLTTPPATSGLLVKDMVLLQSGNGPKLYFFM